MDRYDNYFEVTEELYCEALKKMIPAARYVVYAVCAIILGVSSFVMFYGGNIQTGFCGFSSLCFWLFTAFTE